MVIVAAVDDSDRATPVLAEAQRLAADLGTELHAIHVLERSEFVEVLQKDVESQELTDNYEVQQVGENIVSRSLNRPVEADLTVSVCVGDPATEIVTYAEQVAARYVVVGGRQQSPAGKALFGSVTQEVMFDSPVAVLNVNLE